jgi:hypothetical protein
MVDSIQTPSIIQQHTLYHLKTSFIMRNIVLVHDKKSVLNTLSCTIGKSAFYVCKNVSFLKKPSKLHNKTITNR